MVEFKNVVKIYDNVAPVVNNVSFKIDKGEFVFLIGPSGSGKTTLIKMLIRDEAPTAGSIFFNGIDITKLSRGKIYKLRREIGVVFQDYKLIPDKTAYENVAFAMEAAGKKNKEIEESVPYVLDIVGLENRMNAFPRQLSGGEQQRIAIARAIANNPGILIADEPTGNLDPASAWDIVQVLTKINNWGTTVIMSTHGTDIVNSLNKRVVQMDKGSIARDDNKGQYEFSRYGDNDILEEKKEVLEQQEEIEKKKKFKVKLSTDLQATASKLSEVMGPTNETPNNKLGGFLSFFRKKQEKDLKKNDEIFNIEDSESIVNKIEEVEEILETSEETNVKHKLQDEGLVDDNSDKKTSGSTKQELKRPLVIKKNKRSKSSKKK